MPEVKAVIVYFTENTPLNFQFKKWTNHITIVPPFVTKDIGLLHEQIAQVCQHTYRFSYRVGEPDLFGGQRKLAVNRVVNSPNLLALHAQLFAIAQQHDPNVSTKYAFDFYTPHITHNSLPVPKQDTTDTLDRIYLVVHTDINKKDKMVQQIYNLR